MCRSRDDHKLLLAAQLWKGYPVQFDHLDIVSTDDEQRGGANMGQRRPGQNRQPAARDDGSDHVGSLRRRDQGGGSTGAGAKVANREAARILRTLVL